MSWISYTQIKGFQTAWHSADCHPTTFTYVIYWLLRIHINCNYFLILLKISWDISVHFGWVCCQVELWRQRANKDTSCVTCSTNQFKTFYYCAQQGKTDHPKTLPKTVCNAWELRHLQAPQSKTCTGTTVSFFLSKLTSFKLCLLLHLNSETQAISRVLKENLENGRSLCKKIREVSWYSMCLCLLILGKDFS